MADETLIGLRPATYERHAAAVEYAERDIRTRAPLPGDDRSPGLAPGAWGRLASGGTITAASGLTLGSGSVKLCARDGSLPASPETVTVSNAGAAITASGSDKIVRLAWTLGEWCVNCAS